MKKKFLTPINIEPPPCHTQIHPRCFTCNRFETCNIRDDYLKTATLIQQVLGDPQQDELLVDYEDYAPPELYGHKFRREDLIFPQTLILSNGIELTFVEAKWQSLNLAQMMYSSIEYKIVFPIMWNLEERTYEIIDGFEKTKSLEFEIKEENKKEICFNLKTWRQEVKDQIQEGRKDIINTTFFTPRLECKFYQHIRGMSEEEGIQRIIRRFPRGVPCRDGSFYHLATFHIEPNKIPLYHPENGQVAIMPMPYPVFVPAKVKDEDKPKRRGDIYE